MSIHERKIDHIDLTVKGLASYEQTSGFERVKLIHNALPELDLDQIDTRVEFLGRLFDFPLFISSMTGGTNELGTMNAQLAEVAAQMNIPIGLGSQRVMIDDPRSMTSFTVARDVAPNAFICANIGGQQLLEVSSNLLQKRIIDPVRADALIIHLNVLQEMMQPEGDTTFKGIAASISKLVKELTIPIIVKETGAGISGKVAQRLYDLGVRVVDVAGSGGTSWAKVENLRERTKTPRHDFNEWGIPTVLCLTQISQLAIDDLTVISSGGVRSPLDLLKSLALGAKMAAMAQPIIKVLHDSGQDGLLTYLDNFKKEIRIGMLLLGTKQVSEIGPEHIYVQ